MIIASDIIKTYGDRKILDGASLEVKAGQCVVMTGDNGSGKTTLLHVMAGLRRPDRGEVRWKGELLTGAPGTPHITDPHPLVRPVRGSNQ